MKTNWFSQEYPFLNDFVRYVLFCALVVFISCSENDSHSERYKRFFEEMNISSPLTKGKKVVVILPQVGCNGCISEMEKFLLSNTDNNIYFVLTNFDSRKTLQHKILSKVSEETKIVLDEGNLLFEYGLDSIYPQILLFSNGEIIRIIENNPYEKFSHETIKGHLYDTR